jgi:hypothetical protein
MNRDPGVEALRTKLRAYYLDALQLYMENKNIKHHDIQELRAIRDTLIGE